MSGDGSIAASDEAGIGSSGGECSGPHQKMFQVVDDGAKTLGEI